MGIKNYGDIIEIAFTKNLMETVHFIDFYFKDNTDAWLDLKGDALKHLKERGGAFNAIMKIIDYEKKCINKI